MGKRSKKRNYKIKKMNVSDSNSESQVTVSNEESCNVKKINQNEESQIGTEATLVRARKNKKSKFLKPNKNITSISNKFIEIDHNDKSHHEITEENKNETRSSSKIFKQKKHDNFTSEEVQDATLSQHAENSKMKRKKCTVSDKAVVPENMVKERVKDTIKNYKNDCKESGEDKEAPKDVVNQAIDTDDKEKPKKKKKRKIIKEEIINDDDIDRYCEDLDEVHNQQYEDWVILIEANLNSNKKVKKC